MSQDSKITDDFERFVTAISLNQKETEDIIAKHNELTNVIVSEPPENYKIIKTRLSGSYAKRTVLNEVDETALPDVDVVIIIESEKEDADEINADFFEQLKSKKEKVTQEIRQQSNSIGIIYKNISVDFVLGKQDGSGNLSITSHKKHGWLESNALKHVDYMFQRNKEYEISYFSLMKLFKYLNKYCITSSLKSFTLEMIIHQCAPKADIDQTLPQMFTDTLANILGINSIEDIKDCIDDTKTAYDEKDKDKFELFKSEIESIYDKAVTALSGDRKKWEEIFGNSFPKQPDSKAQNNNIYSKNQNPWCSNGYRKY